MQRLSSLDMSLKIYWWFRHKRITNVFDLMQSLMWSDNVMIYNFREGLIAAVQTIAIFLLIIIPFVIWARGIGQLWILFMIPIRCDLLRRCWCVVSCSACLHV